MDRDWDGGVDHIRDSRGRGVSDDLGGAMLSPGEMLELLPFPRRGKDIMV